MNVPILLPLIDFQAPPIQPIDLTSLLAIFMGTLTVLIPIAGFTARYALKPIAEAIAQMREGQGSRQEMKLMDQRMALLEQQIGAMETDVRRISEAAEFDRQLRAGDS